MKRTAFAASEPPPSMIQPSKSAGQAIYDLVGMPFRMALLPDDVSERVGLTSLRSERFAAVLPELRGRVLDVGAGDNLLIRLYRREAMRLGVSPADATASVGIDVTDWGSDCVIVRSSAELPFRDASFDTVSFLACLNHIPERREALREARRVLKPGGRVVLTMIGRFIGWFGHKIWWYSEDKHREVDPGERWGLSSSELKELLREADLRLTTTRSFAYGLNNLYIAAKPE